MKWDGRIRADARMLPIADRSVQCIVTSPPYFGLRDYGNSDQIGLEASPREYVNAIREVAFEMWRVLKDDGTLWLNLGDSYASAWACKRRNIIGSGSPDDSVSRGRTGNGLKEKDLVGIPWRVAFALQEDGWYLRSDIIWHKPNPMPESVTDRPTKDHEYIFLLTKSERYFYDEAAIAEPSSGLTGGRFGAGGYEQGRFRNDSARSRPEDTGTRNKRSVWTIATQPYSGSHFATFPEEIPEICIRAGSRPGDVVLDPFFNSGTVGRVAERLNRRWIGIDLGYQELQAKRVSNVQRELTCFSLPHS